MALTQIDDRGLKTPIDLLDNEEIRFGTGNDLSIYHNGSHSYITDTGTGSLKIDTSQLLLRDGSGSDSMITATADGAVDLYYNNSSKLQTTNTGTNVTGVHVDDGATHDGDVSFNGASYNAWWDKSDSSFKVDDYAKIKVGTGGDLQIFHDTNDSYIRDSGTGDLYIDSNKLKVNNAASNETMAIFTADGSVELYYNNVRKLETFADGVQFDDNIVIKDSKKANFGDGYDLQISHDGTDNYINAIAGNLYLRGPADASKWIILQAHSGENSVVAKPDAAVELYYDGTKTFETISSGVNVTGGIRVGGNNAANELDDYEEGTFSATADASGYTNAACVDEYYTKIGNVVHVCFRLNVTSNLSDADLTISGLPFTNSGSAGYCSMQWQDGAGFTIGGGRISGTSVERFGMIAAPDHSGTVNFYFQGTYRT